MTDIHDQKQPQMIANDFKLMQKALTGKYIWPQMTVNDHKQLQMSINVCSADSAHDLKRHIYMAVNDCK